MAPPLKGVVAGVAFRRSLVELVLAQLLVALAVDVGLAPAHDLLPAQGLVLAGLLLVGLALRPPGVAATSECVGPGLASRGAV